MQDTPIKCSSRYSSENISGIAYLPGMIEISDSINKRREWAYEQLQQMNVHSSDVENISKDWLAVGSYLTQAVSVYVG